MGTLWFGGTFYTLNKENETVEAVYVEKGRIKEIGKRSELERKYKAAIDRKMDIDGGYVYPGFVDSHLHMIGHGEKLMQLDLSDVSSAEEMKEHVLRKVSELKEGEWLIGEGWNENNFPDRKIFHRIELDEIAPNNPMVLKRVCRHALLANTKALEISKINSNTEEPPGGIIVKDAENIPTGYLLDSAQELVLKNIPMVSEAYLEKALTKAVVDMHQLGFVGGHTEDLHYYGGFLRTFNTFLKVIDGSKKKFRANLLVHHEAVDEMKENQYSFGKINDFLELGAMKIFADGALGGRTALLRLPYNDAPETSGVAIHTKEELKHLVSKARQLHMPVAIHTIGDLALEYALDAIEAFPVEEGLRDRIIHAQIVPDDLLARMAKLSLIVDIQPRFVASDFPWVEERLGQDRLPFSFAWKKLLNGGLHCAGGSDAPIEPVNPLLGIHAAITRRKPEEEYHEGYGVEQKLTRWEAIHLFTTGSAYAIGKEAIRGLIYPNYVADFTILDQDLFHCKEEEILKANVLQTVVDDTVMYER